MNIAKVSIIFLIGSLFCFSVSGAESSIIGETFNDEFSLYYEETVGYFFSIAETVDGKEHLYLQKDVAAPLAEISTSDYIIRVTEVLSTHDMVIVNVELQITNAESVIRPYESMFDADMFYTPVSDYLVPVYFYRVQVDGEGASSGGSMCALGISDNDKKMNRIESWTHHSEDGTTVQTSEHVEISIHIDVVCAQDDIKTKNSILITLCVPQNCWLVYTP